MTTGAVVWLGILLVLLVLAVIVLRRVSALVARTRELERFQQAVASLDARLEAAVSPLVSSLDELRRQAGDPKVVEEGLETVQPALRALASEARDLRVPPALAGTASALVGELDRAARATEFVEHGLGAMRAARRGREVEAQTALKRGVLNLRHAREAVGRLAADVAAVRPADLRGESPAGPVVVRPVARFEADDGAPDDASYPRM